jgi:uncharacterized protein DUF6526
MSNQNLANHTRFVPPFHFFVLPVLLGNFLYSLYAWYKIGWSLGGLWRAIVAFAIAYGFVLVRVMSLTVQNRVIRLEETLRYERLLPPDLKARIAEFTIGQIVSLRFASDAELPALARKVLDDKMEQRNAIKQLVKTWRADYLRA